MNHNEPSTLHDIETAVWRELQSCTRDRAHAWRTPVLATSDGQGNADARVVVLQEVVPEARLLRFFTDARSPKRAQIELRPRAVVVMWSPVLCWQLRLSVNVAVLTTGEAVSSRWTRLKRSPAAGDYLALQRPGEELAALSEQRPRPAAVAQGPHGNLALLDATVTAVDWLELRTAGQRRARFEPHRTRWVQP